jgi:hypothetical protein
MTAVTTTPAVSPATLAPPAPRGLWLRAVAIRALGRAAVR